MLQLTVDTSTLRRRPSGSLSGVIRFSIGDDVFPDESWDDFVGVLLPFWLDAVTRLVRGFSRRERLSFMDGPPIVELAVDGAALRFRALSDGRRLVLDVPVAGGVAGLVKTFLAVSRSVVSSCEANGLKGDDLREIIEKADTLEEAWSSARSDY